MDIKTFRNIVSSLPADISVLLRGPTGIGKSHLFHQIAGDIEVDDLKGLPVIDRRLSQMTEGDIIGLPQLVDGVTRFCPVDWIVKACHEPVVLFLDEINRATPEVMQCAFQLVLDRELNGNRLHPETRIYCAINASSDYQVNEIDPALLRRFWTVDLEPTKADWIKWAGENDIDPVVIDFIKDNEAHLRHIGAMEPGKVYPNPASWERLSKASTYAGLAPTEHTGKSTPAGLYGLCMGFVGVEAAIAFTDYVKSIESQISAEEVLNDFDKIKGRVDKLTTEKKNALIERLVNHCKDNEWTVKQAKRATDFVKPLSGEMIVSFFNQVMETNNVPNIRAVHKFIGMKVVEIVTAAERT
jgi:hypothetical protein